MVEDVVGVEVGAGVKGAVNVDNHIAVYTRFIFQHSAIFAPFISNNLGNSKMNQKKLFEMFLLSVLNHTNPPVSREVLP